MVGIKNRTLLILSFFMILFFQNCGGFQSNSGVGSSSNSFGDGSEIRLQKRMVLLTKDQYFNTLSQHLTNDSDRDQLRQMSLPFNRTDPALRFSSHRDSFSVTETDIDLAWDMAEFVAEKKAQNVVSSNQGCFLQGDTTDDCLKQRMAHWTKLIFSRPVTDEDLDTFLPAMKQNSIHESNKQEALTRLFLSLFMSPHFYYRTELAGSGGNKMGDYEIAKYLAYTLTDNPPDAPLMKAAEKGLLQNKAEREAQARRLLGEIENNSSVLHFLQEYFKYSTMDSNKDMDQFPEFDFNELVKDTDFLVRSILESHAENDFWKEIMSTDRIAASPQTATNYGVSNSDVNNTRRVIASKDNRVGILTQPSWLVHFSKDEDNFVIGRGKFIREDILCGEIPNREIDNVPPIPEEPDATLRERMAITESGSCYECHVTMNPLGYGFESYDQFGRFRTSEAGHPVDASGWVEGSGDQDGEFSDHKGLMTQLSNSKTTQACFLAHSLQYLMGASHRPKIQSNQLRPFINFYDDSEGNFKEVLIEMISSEAAITREGP
jgi:hypothetical protein